MYVLYIAKYRLCSIFVIDRWALRESVGFSLLKFCAIRAEKTRKLCYGFCQICNKIFIHELVAFYCHFLIE